ncbi:transporter family protein [Pontibacter mangrovi]|uniref:Transporter n=1 Tax=Pontibacter mangrovi TaxID=2589816 RepID=A0A501VYX5_9BACT|nr:hypothetical protein [Pontibacter mangrovi]TPE42943.1 hypothetical protein FJM65_14935 [Pontibacter mangrovi]
MKLNYKILLLCLLTCASACFPAFAQEQEKEKETFAQPIQEFPFAEPVYLQDQHEIQSTLNYYHDYNSEYIGNNLSFEVEYGIMDWWQVSAEYGHHYQHRPVQKSYNINDLELGTMFSVFNTARQAASFAMSVEIPVKKPALAGEEVDGVNTSFSPMLIYARQLGSKAQLHLNGGTEIEQQEYEWFYNAAAVYGSGHWHPLLELNGTYQDKEAEWYLAPGFVLNGNSNWELVAGARRSLRHNDWGGSVKLLFEFTAGRH